MDEVAIPHMRVLAIWAGTFAGLMMMLVGGLFPSAIIIPGLTIPPKVLDLPSTLQVPALLLCSLVCGPRSGVMASIAYLTIGLFYFPAFHGGGNLEYIGSPGFGYLTAFLPAAWVSGRLSRNADSNDLIYLTLCALAGLIVIHLWGGAYLIIGSIGSDWSETLPELLYKYSIGPFPAQLLLCPGVGIISLGLKRALFIE